MKILDVNQMTKDFGGLRAVDGLTLSIEKGQILGLIGPNGAGKSTAFNCIAGVFPPRRAKSSLTGSRSTVPSRGIFASRVWRERFKSSNPSPPKASFTM